MLAVTENGYGGLEHCWSSSLVCSRSDLPKRKDPGTSDGYRKFLGLCSHEYFHLWNVKRMKPGTLHTVRTGCRKPHRAPVGVRGITSYYTIFSCPGGADFRRELPRVAGETITRRASDRWEFRQTVEDASFDALDEILQARCEFAEHDRELLRERIARGAGAGPDDP